MFMASRRWILMAAFVLVPLSLSARGWQEAGGQRQTGNERQFIEELKREILEELLSGDFLRQQIELGIKNYLQNEQAAKTLAAAEQARLANEMVQIVRPVSGARDHIYGNPDAAISLIEYF